MFKENYLRNMYVVFKKWEVCGKILFFVMINFLLLWGFEVVKVLKIRVFKNILVIF